MAHIESNKTKQSLVNAFLLFRRRQVFDVHNKIVRLFDVAWPPVDDVTVSRVQDPGVARELLPGADAVGHIEDDEPPDVSSAAWQLETD